MTQINQYATSITTDPGANPLNENDLFDIDKLMDGGIYESQKMKWGTLQTYLASGAANLGTSDLIQTDGQRTFNGGNKNLLWDQLRRFFITMPDWGDDPLAGFSIDQAGLAGLVANNRTFVDIRKNGAVAMRIFENGHVEINPQFNGAIGENGGLAVGDGSLPLQAITTNQSNAGILALFSSSERPSVFTDSLIPELPTTFEPQNSAIAWFRSFSKGVLFPNMGTIQRDAIITPEKGLVIFNTDVNKLQVYSSIGLTGWQNMN